MCIQQVVQISKDIKEIEESIALQNGDAKRIMSMTGFGSFGALLIALDWQHQKIYNAKETGVLDGNVQLYTNPGMIYHGKMKKDSNRRVNWMMIQAANVAAFKDSRMKEIYERARTKHPHGIAISHVAKDGNHHLAYLTQTLYNERKNGLYEKKLKKIGYRLEEERIEHIRLEFTWMFYAQS